MAADDYIDVKFDVFEHTGQRARVRKTLLISTLIDEILKEFDDIPADSPEKYAIFLKGADRPLDHAQTLDELDIQPQDELVFDHFHQAIRQMLAVEQYAFLHEEKTGKTYDIQWQPAVVGRPSTDMNHNIILAVNVQLLPEGKTISRRHAQITLTEGRYYIEPLADENPVFVNGKEIPPHKRHEIRNGDKIGFGHHRLMMAFQTQASSSRASRPYAPRAAAPAAGPSPHETVIERPAGSETPTASLVVETAGDAALQGQRIGISSYPYLLGRTHPQLKNESQVSRRHAEITYDQQTRQFSITDLQSTNGVTVDHRRIPANTPTEIRAGTRIGLGNVLAMIFEL
ncbi:MAG: FHA domain-containing protein [Chloroflexota bacterium]